VEPIFDVLGRQTLWLERVGDGSRLKLAVSNWLAVLVEGMAETLALSKTLGLDPGRFVETIAGGPLASAYAVNKGHGDGDITSAITGSAATASQGGSR
jgi:3-hydroxyisobutyrate dehydrogenase